MIAATRKMAAEDKCSIPRRLFIQDPMTSPFDVAQRLANLFSRDLTTTLIILSRRPLVDEAEMWEALEESSPNLDVRLITEVDGKDLAAKKKELGDELLRTRKYTFILIKYEVFGQLLTWKDANFDQLVDHVLYISGCRNYRVILFASERPIGPSYSSFKNIDPRFQNSLTTHFHFDDDQSLV